MSLSDMPVEATDGPAKGPKASMYMNHKDFPEAKKMMPGDEGVMKVHYKVRSHSQHDDGNGSTDIDVHKIEHEGKPGKKKQNAANMPMDKLKEVIKSSQPKDKFNGTDAE